MNHRLIVAPECDRAVYDVESLFGLVVYMDRDPTGPRGRMPLLRREAGLGTAVKKGDVEPQQREPLTVMAHGPDATAVGPLALSLRGLLFRFVVSVTSDEVEMVPTGRRADSL
jgi:hypothetical protein